MTGSAVQWVGEFLGLANPVADTVALANSVPDSDGVVFRSSHGRPRCPVLGRACSRYDIQSRAFAYSGTSRAEPLSTPSPFRLPMSSSPWRKRHPTSVPALRVDGGATRNAALMQFQSDILCRPVLRSSNEELSGLGAAWLGGLTLGWWNSLDEIEHLPHPSECFEPSMPATERDLLYSRWQLAVSRARLQGAPA